MMRDDIAAVETAKNLGFKVVRTSNRSRLERSEYQIGDPIPHNLLSFEIGRVVVWQVRGGWHFAELIDGHDITPIILKLWTCRHASILRGMSIKPRNLSSERDFSFILAARLTATARRLFSPPPNGSIERFSPQFVAVI